MRFFNVFGKTKVQPPSETDMFLAALTRTHAIAWFGPDATLIEANAAFCDILGYDAAEIIGLHHDSLVAFAVRGTPADDTFVSALKGVGQLGDTVPRKSKSGRLIWLHTTYVPVTSLTGDVVKVAKIARDVTESHLAACNKMQQFDAIGDSQAKIVFDLHGIILEANPLFLDTMGYSLSEVVGSHHQMFVHPEYAGSQKYKDFWSGIANGNFKTGVFRRYRKDDTPVWLQATYSPVLNAVGELIKVVQVASDVTEKEDANDLKTMVSRVQAVIEFDARGNIISANDLFLDATGYAADDLKGKHHSMFMCDNEASTMEYAAHWEALGKGEFKAGDYKRRHKDGSEVWLNAAYNPVYGPDGSPVKVVKYATNITARMHAVKTLRAGLEYLAMGNLSRPINIPFSEDFEPLREDYNAAVDRLQSSIQAVVDATLEINAGTVEITNASNDLSRRTESQAAALEQTSAAITQMAASVKSTSQIANQANELVEKTKSHATIGSGIMQNARTAMTAIASSSEEISKITSLIEDIAFQTNLLALNAGVEAARAGPAGRGFAVVASEVRALALRSSEAATQISHLITTSVNQVEQGVDLVSRTGVSLEQIEGFVSDVAAMVADIASAAAEQSGGIAEITTSVNELESVTQKNAAMFEETNAATQLLANEVDALGKITEAFSLHTTSAGTVPDATRLKQAS